MSQTQRWWPYSVLSRVGLSGRSEEGTGEEPFVCPLGEEAGGEVSGWSDQILTVVSAEHVASCLCASRQQASASSAETQAGSKCRSALCIWAEKDLQAISIVRRESRSRLQIRIVPS